MTMKKDKRIRQLEAELEAKNTVIESLKQELNYVREQLVLYKKTFYGSRSEKIEIPDQLTLNLFNEAETESTVLKTEPELQVRVTSHSRKKSKKRGIEDLPETVVEHDLEDKTDPQTGKPLRLIGTNERKELVHHKEYYEIIKQMRYFFIAMLTLCLFINTNQNNQQYETYEKIDDLYESEAVKTKTTNCIKKVKNQEIIYYERNITIKNDIYNATHEYRNIKRLSI